MLQSKTLAALLHSEHSIRILNNLADASGTQTTCTMMLLLEMVVDNKMVV